MTGYTAPRLPRALTAGGSSVAVIGRPISAGALAHKPFSQTRTVSAPRSRALAGSRETYYVAACAASLPKKDQDEAYQVSAAWADHLGALACTEHACFPDV